MSEHRSHPHPVTSLVRLGFELDAHGFDGREAAIRRVVSTARSCGLDSAALDVLADIAEPDVARLRAFAVVTSALARPKNAGRFAGAA